MAISYLLSEQTNTIHIKNGNNSFCGASSPQFKDYKSLKQILAETDGKARICRTCQKKASAVVPKAVAEIEQLMEREAEKRKADEKRRKEAQVLAQREAQAWQNMKQEEETRKRDQMQQQLQQQEEAKKHNLGCLMTIGGLLFIVLACAMHGGAPAVTVGMIGFVLFFIGFFPAINNRSASKIVEDKAMASAIVSNWGAKVKAGESITGKDVDNAISAMGMDGVQKHEERKKIIAGAVTGGIVAGDVGAVAGAVAAKAKIEEEKLKK